MAEGTGYGLKTSSRPVLTEPTPVVDTGRAVASAWGSIAAAGEQLASVAGREIEKEQRRVLVGEIAEKEVEWRDFTRNLFDESASAPGGPDPAAYEQKARAFYEGQMKEMEPRLVPHMQQVYSRGLDSDVTKLMTMKRSHALGLAQEKWKALQDVTGNDFLSAALSGTLNTEEGKAKAEKYREVVRTGVADGFVSQEEADRRIANLTGQATVYSQRNAVRGMYEEGGAAAANKFIDEVTLDENLSLSPKQRFALSARLKADVHALEAQRKADLAPVIEEAKALLDARKNGLTIDQGRIDQAVERFQRYGGQAEAASFLADMRRSESAAWMKSAPIGDSARYLRDFKVSRGLANGSVAGVVDRIVGVESGGNPNARASTSSAGGLGQFTEGTWLDMVSRHRPDLLQGRSREEVLALRFGKENAALNREMTGRLAADNAAALGLAGVQVTAGSVYLAHFLGSGDAVRVLRAPAHAPISTVVNAASINANPAVFNKAKTAGDIIAWADRKMGGASVPAAPASASAGDIKFAGEQHKALYDRTDKALDAMQADMAKGALPTAGDFNDVLTAAGTVQDPALYDKASKIAAEWQFRREFGRQPAAEDQAELNAMRQRAATEGLTEADSREFAVADEMHKAKVAALKDDPLTYAIGALGDQVKLPAPQPLNTADGDAFRQGLALRAQWAQVASNTYQIGPQAALQKADIAGLQGALETASWNDKVRIFGDMAATLPGDVYRETVGKLGGNKLTQFAGMVALNQPDLARDILQGQSLLASKEIGNKGDVVRVALENKFGGLVYPDPEMQNVVVQSALAVYAAERGINAALYSDTDQAGIERAIERITGPMAKRNGKMTPAPPGMTGGMGRLADIMNNLRSEDLELFGGAFSASGQPMDARELGRRAILVPLEPGGWLYSVQMPTADGRGAPVLSDPAGDGVGGTPLVIDMKMLDNRDRPVAPARRGTLAPLRRMLRERDFP